MAFVVSSSQPVLIIGSLVLSWWVTCFGRRGVTPKRPYVVGSLRAVIGDRYCWCQAARRLDAELAETQQRASLFARGNR